MILGKIRTWLIISILHRNGADVTDLAGQYLGRYYLSERLGEGGMAVVYKAYDTRLEREVAIKIIRSGAFPADALSEVLKRFEREAKSLAKLSHPSIVKVYDYGEHDGSPYLVMEYLPGGTLKKSLGKCVPWQEAVRLLLPVARGVAYAHQRGILHRDIKPANILITESGDPMLSDFGIAKLFEGEQTTALTGSGMAIGTPEYMAPEQWTGVTSPQSDLYSLGIVLYEMVTGRKPYVADTPAAILIKQATEPLPSPRKFSEELPEALELALIKALAREPGDRYKDLNTFIGALENLSVSTPVVSSPAEEKPVKEKASLQESVPPVSTKALERYDSKGMPVKAPAAKTRLPVKFSRKGLGFLSGGTVVLLAVWLVLPRIGEWFSPAPVVTELATATITFTDQIAGSQTLEPFQVTETPTSVVAPTNVMSPTPVPLPAEITDAGGVTMHLVPAGEFTMGGMAVDALFECQNFVNNCQEDWFKDAEPPHTIYLDSFYMDKYEVTNGFYKVCVEAGDCTPPHQLISYTHPDYYVDSEFNDYPVTFVDWNQANTYCEWRGAQLPTEAQWEKAARGTDGRTYPWGEGITCAQANYWSKDGGCVGDTTIVGHYESGKSPYGIYDLAGNVSEWVVDRYSDTYYQNPPTSNPLGPDRGLDRVYRGGNFYYDPFGVIVFSSLSGLPDDYYFTLGFRCARDATP